MKKMYAIFSVLVLLMVSCSFLQTSEDDLFNSGLESLKIGDYYGAIESFNKIDSTNPESPYGYYGRAIAKEKDRRDIDALNEYLRILTNNSDFAPGLKALVKLAAKTDHPSMALEFSSQYRQSEDDSLAVFALNAEMLLFIGEYQLAREEMAKLTTESSCNSQQHLFYSKLLLHDGDLEASLNHCSQAVAENRDNIEILLEAGDIYASIGYNDSAAIYYHDALKIGKTDYYQKADIAESFIDINYLADAYRLVNELAQVTSNNNVIPYLKTKLMLARGQAVRAKEYYAKMVSKNRISPAQQLYMAEVKWVSKDIQGTIMAMEHADQIAEGENYHLGLRNEITLKKPQLFLNNGDWRSADGIMTTLEGLLPLDFETVYLKSGIGFLSGKIAAANESLTRLEILVEDNPPRLVKIADLYMQVDSSEKAAYYYNQALTFDKINIGAILGKVKILIRKNRFNDAINFLESLDNSVIYNRLISSELISLYRETGNIKRARDFVGSLIKIASGDIDHYRLAIELAKEDDSPEDVEPIVKSCLENNRDNAVALLLAGVYYMENGANDEAEGYFQAAVPFNTMMDDLYCQFGLIMEEKGEADSALAYFDKSIKINQFTGKPYSRMAAIMIDKDDLDQKMLATLMNYIRIAQRTYRDPDDYITMGRAEIVQTRYKAAGKNFEKALDIDSRNPVYNYYSGINYINLDSLQKAKTFLNKAIKNGLSGELKSKAENALSRL